MTNRNDDREPLDDGLIPDTVHRSQVDRETYQAVMSPDDVAPPWKEGDILNPFRLEKFLGKGSSGYVYRATHQKTNRRWALKLLMLDDPETLVRSKLGFRRMMNVRCPGIVHVDRIYHLDGYFALTMDEVRGITFKDAIKELKNCAKADAYDILLDLLRQYACALTAMHHQDLVHRDIKPRNLMVDDDGKGWLIDYGLVGTAGIKDGTTGIRNYLVGTPHYIAPESMWEQSYSPASDLFSLGIVVLEAICAIHQANEPYSVLLSRSERNQRDDVERLASTLSSLVGKVPQLLLDACVEMLQREPSARPTAAELSQLGLTKRVCMLPDNAQIIGRDLELQRAKDWIDHIFAGGIGRLHIEGVSGIGKSHFVRELVDYIAQKRWAQAFFGKCQRGEDQPLQAFDQICDAIATRYLQSDRETMMLDPVSVQILHTAFPVLQKAVQASTSVYSTPKSSERLTALEAAVRLSQKLRETGPLFFVVDDIQWADEDSLNVLNTFQNVDGEPLGIITVSRPRGDRQMVAPNQRIDLGPIDDDSAKTILENSSRRWSTSINKDLRREIIAAAGGNPFRLFDFVEELRPGGILHDQVSAERKPGDSSVVLHLGDLWRIRYKNLSEDAKEVFNFILTAGHPVSTRQLAELTGLDSTIDVSISELVHRRLITDEATGGECLSVIHDQVTESMLGVISRSEQLKCHEQWALYLSYQANPQELAARIAGHFFDAGQPNRAVSHAILAAEHAERFVAKTEAARWHAKVIPYLSGAEKKDRILKAAQTYEQADRPAEAARYYQELAAESTGDEGVGYQLRATTLLVRGGHFSAARDQLRSLCNQLRVPRPKPTWMSQLSMIKAIPKLKLATLRKATAPKCKNVSAREQQRLELCLSLSRPLSMFDNMHAQELAIAGTTRAYRYGDEAQILLAEIGEAVFGCYDKGMSRVKGENALKQLHKRAIQLGHHKGLGDVFAAKAFSHAFALRWDCFAAPLRSCEKHYSLDSKPNGFELTHVRWLQPWCLWNLGRFNLLSRYAVDAYQEAIQQNDLFRQVSFTTGLASTAWLAKDDLAAITLHRERNAKLRIPDVGMQILDICEVIAEAHTSLYKGDFDSAWLSAVELDKATSSPHRYLQFLRVMNLSIGTLVCLHQVKHSSNTDWRTRATRFLAKLKQEQLSYTDMLWNFFGGLFLSMTSSSGIGDRQAQAQLKQASLLAKQQHLRAIQLAAEDSLESNTDSGRLMERMKDQEVVDPKKLMRLYTI